MMRYNNSSNKRYLQPVPSCKHNRDKEYPAHVPQYFEHIKYLYLVLYHEYLGLLQI